MIIAPITHRGAVAQPQAGDQAGAEAEHDENHLGGSGRRLRIRAHQFAKLSLVLRIGRWIDGLCRRIPAGIFFPPKPISGAGLQNRQGIERARAAEDQFTTVILRSPSWAYKRVAFTATRARIYGQRYMLNRPSMCGHPFVGPDVVPSSERQRIKSSTVG